MENKRTIITDLPYIISGVSHEALDKYDHNSKKKIEQIGGFVMVPVMLWFITGYGASDLTGGAWFRSVFIGFIASVFIFIVERSLIIGKSTHWAMVAVRALLGFLVAIIGSFFIDLSIFNADIEKLTYDNFDRESQTKIDSAMMLLRVGNESLNQEMTGSGGSGKRGFGFISSELKLQQGKQENLIAKLDSAYVHDRTALFDPDHTDHEMVRTRLGMNTIAYKMELFDELIKRNTLSKVLWILMLFAGLIFEIMPIFSKAISKPSAFELDMEAHEQVLANRRKRILANSNRYAGMSYGEATVQKMIEKSIS